MGYEIRRALELCQAIARDKTLAWLEDAVGQVRWKGGGKRCARVKDGLIVVVPALRVQSCRIEAPSSRSCAGLDPCPAAG